MGNLPKLEEALYIMRGWGFRYVTTAFTSRGKNLGKKRQAIFSGMGKWTRANSEICFCGTKGNISRVDASVPQVILSPVGEHSKKPDEVRQRILKLMGDLPRIELFAREKHIGWDAWGDEIQNDIEIPFNNFNAQEDEK